MEAADAAGPSVRWDGARLLSGGDPVLVLAVPFPLNAPMELLLERIGRARRFGMNAVEIVVETADSLSATALEIASRLDGVLTECALQKIFALVRVSAPAASRRDPVEAILAVHLSAAGGCVIQAERVTDSARGGNGQAALGPADADRTADPWRDLAEGSTTLRFAPFSISGHEDDSPYAARRVALFARTFAPILLRGTHRRDLAAVRGGLHANETATAQCGGILWIDNPDSERTVTGSIFPYLPELTLAPRQRFAYVHDAPIGAGANYLGSYAGLVKSDADVLTAHILPDPLDGIRVYVYGEPGTTREVAVWSGNERGRGVNVAFSAGEPLLYRVGMSQIVALSPHQAGRTWLPDDLATAPVLIGPDDVTEYDGNGATIALAPGREHRVWMLRADGSIETTEVETSALTAPPPSASWEWNYERLGAIDFDDSGWREIDDIALDHLSHDIGTALNGWYRATVRLPDGDGGDAQLHFSAPAGTLSVLVNGEQVYLSPALEAAGGSLFDVRLRDGENVICVYLQSVSNPTPTAFGAVTLTPTGGCYLIDVTRWRFYPEAPAPAIVRLSFGQQARNYAATAARVWS